MEDKEVILKYQLPPESELLSELGPYDSEDKGLILTLIGKLINISQNYTDFLEDMLHPDSNITSMQEASMFSNEEREAMYDLFRELTLFQRKQLLIQLTTSEEEKVTYFKEFYAFWLSKKNTLKAHIAQALLVWSVDKNIPQMAQGYFG